MRHDESRTFPSAKLLTDAPELNETIDELVGVIFNEVINRFYIIGFQCL